MNIRERHQRAKERLAQLDRIPEWSFNLAKTLSDDDCDAIFFKHLGEYAKDLAKFYGGYKTIWLGVGRLDGSTRKEDDAVYRLRIKMEYMEQVATEILEELEELCDVDGMADVKS